MQTRFGLPVCRHSNVLELIPGRRYWESHGASSTSLWRQAWSKSYCRCCWASCQFLCHAKSKCWTPPATRRCACCCCCCGRPRIFRLQYSESDDPHTPWDCCWDLCIGNESSWPPEFPPGECAPRLIQLRTRRSTNTRSGFQVRDRDNR